MKISRLLFYLLIIVGAWNYFSTRPVSRPSGILVTSDPEQINITNGHVFSVHDYQITPLAKFSVRARVLSVEKYHLGREADLSPIDLALGWGVMSDTAVINKLAISQSNRFYFYSWPDQPPLPLKDMVEHSANMHFIPANADIEKKLHQVNLGSIVDFSGYLVRVEARDGWKWTSSLTRADSGAGACEVVWLEKLNIQ